MLIGIIYNWKGLKEENYLYTLDEMAELDFELLQDCISSPEEWHDSSTAECAWKTWMGKLIRTDNELIDFLNGNWNECDSEEDSYDWYWANQISNGLYGEMSNTMKDNIIKYNISDDLCQ